MPINKDAVAGSKVDTTMAPYNVIPVADEWSKPFWDGARERKLIIQRCQSCGYYQHPPAFICMNCKDRDAPLAPEQVSGRGTVYAWFIFHDSSVGGFQERIPYLVAAVELEEQPRLLLASNILNCPYDEVELDMPVEVVWEKVDDETTIPQFQPVRG